MKLSPTQSRALCPHCKSLFVRARRNRKWRLSEFRTIAQMQRDGRTWREIGAEFGVSRKAAQATYAYNRHLVEASP